MLSTGGMTVRKEKHSRSVSNRTMRRAWDRHGDAVFHGQISKHGPHTNYSPRLGRRVFTSGSKRTAKGRNFSEQIYNGRLKLRNLGLRAGILLIPFEESEMRSLVQRAKDMYQAKGRVGIDLTKSLEAAGYNVESMIQLWSVMDTIDDERVEKDTPLNRFI